MISARVEVAANTSTVVLSKRKPGSPLRRTEGELIHLLGGYAQNRFGPGVMAKAWNESFMDDECTPEDQKLHEAAFIPWEKKGASLVMAHPLTDNIKC